jgi:hypothetical protein
MNAITELKTMVGLPDDFPLSTAAGLTQLIHSPAGPFDPTDNWTHCYGVYTTASRASRVGRLKLTRHKNPSTGRVRFVITIDKNHVNGEQHIRATVVANDDQLATPINNSMEAWVDDAKRQPIERTRVEKQAQFTTDASGLSVMYLTDELGSTSETFDGPAVLGWLLFDAVQRLQGAEQKRIDFTLIDHFDQVKPEQRLTYRGQFDVPVRNRNVSFTAYDQIGRGILPTVWWVGESGRLLAVVSGIEAYLLEPNVPQR